MTLHEQGLITEVFPASAVRTVWQCLFKTEDLMVASQRAASPGDGADCSPTNISCNLSGARTERSLKRGSRKCLSCWKVVGPEGQSQEPGASGKAPRRAEPLLEEKSRGFSLDSCFIIFLHTDLFRCSLNPWITF